jgi:hypothetical protein
MPPRLQRPGRGARPDHRPADSGRPAGGPSRRACDSDPPDVIRLGGGDSADHAAMTVIILSLSRLSGCVGPGVAAPAPAGGRARLRGSGWRPGPDRRRAGRWPARPPGGPGPGLLVPAAGPAGAGPGRQRVPRVRRSTVRVCRMMTRILQLRLEVLSVSGRVLTHRAQAGMPVTDRYGSGRASGILTPGP